METIEILDVAQIEPRFKHARIFEKFDLLVDGESFYILNDHDPKPLYYQLLAERGQIFDWEYLEEGPEIWKVCIGKKNNTEKLETIGEMVTADYRKAQVFKKFGIDFCCGGKKTLNEVCSAKKIDIHSVEAELKAVSTPDQSSATNFNDWAPDFLVDYIVNIHHRYVKENIPFITELANKVAKVHGDHIPKLIEVASIFDRMGQDFSSHLVNEEFVVFPYIKELAASKKADVVNIPFSSGSKKNAIGILETEHEQAGEDMAAIRKLTNNYTLPIDACASHTILYKKLEEFENDLFNHVHLENNILFPKAIALEQTNDFESK